MNAVLQDQVNKKPPNHTSIQGDEHADVQSIVVNAPASEVYARLLRLEDLPRFVTSITKIDNVHANGFSCTSIINSKEIKSEVIIMMRVPDRRIAWQAASEHFRVGVIFLDPLLGGATKVTVKVRSMIKPVMLSGALRHYLRNFKQFVESEGAPQLFP
jgi:uncharacterized membrane protein